MILTIPLLCMLSNLGSKHSNYLIISHTNLNFKKYLKYKIVYFLKKSFLKYIGSLTNNDEYFFTKF